MKINISPAALEDIQEIKRYISEELQNPEVARKIVIGILEHIKKVRDFPEIGALLSRKIGTHTNYRFISCGNYLAFYRIKDCTIFFDRVLYAKRDYTRILFSDNNLQQ